MWLRRRLAVPTSTPETTPNANRPFGRSASRTNGTVGTFYETHTQILTHLTDFSSNVPTVRTIIGLHTRQIPYDNLAHLTSPHLPYGDMLLNLSGGMKIHLNETPLW